MRTLLIFGGLAVCVLLVTPSHGDRTEDGGGKMKTMDSESRRLAKRDNSKQDCCPRRSEKPKNCKPCRGSPSGRNYDGTETTPDGEMKTMDSESRRLAKRDNSKQVCCPRRSEKPKNCKRCSTSIGRAHRGTETTPDGEMKTMDSESRRLTKRDDSKQVSCRRRCKQPQKCKTCQGGNSLLGRNYVGTEAPKDEEEIAE